MEDNSSGSLACWNSDLSKFATKRVVPAENGTTPHRINNRHRQIHGPMHIGHDEVGIVPLLNRCGQSSDENFRDMTRRGCRRWGRGGCWGWSGCWGRSRRGGWGRSRRRHLNLECAFINATMRYPVETRSALIILQRRGETVRIEGWITGINGRAAGQKRVSEAQAAIILERTKYRIGADLVTGHIQEAATIVIAQIVAERHD